MRLIHWKNLLNSNIVADFQYQYQFRLADLLVDRMQDGTFVPLIKKSAMYHAVELWHILLEYDSYKKRLAGLF